MGWFCLHKGVFEGVVPVQIAWAGQTAPTCGKILALVSPISEVQGNYEPSMIVNAVAHPLLLLGCIAREATFKQLQRPHPRSTRREGGVNMLTGPYFLEAPKCWNSLSELPRIPVTTYYSHIRGLVVGLYAHVEVRCN